MREGSHDKRMDNKKIIPVVFATDDNYVVPTYLAAYSMLKNLSEDYVARMYVMIPGTLTVEGRKNLLSLESIGNCKVELLNMENEFSNIKMRISYISCATYYRLLLAEYLKQFPKCVYLDSDIIVNCNVADLYNLNLEENYLAGVVATEPTFPEKSDDEKKKYAEMLQVKSVDKYINAGILVMNLETIRRDNMCEAFMALIEKNYPFQDQDILNAACYGKILFLPRKYNVGPLKRNEKAEATFSKEHRDEIEVAYAHPAIVHYAQPQKPWLSRSFPMASYWWKYYDAIDPKFREEYLDEFIRKNRKNAIKVRIKHSKVVMGTWQMLKKIKKNH